MSRSYWHYFNKLLTRIKSNICWKVSVASLLIRRIVVYITLFVFLSIDSFFTFTARQFYFAYYLSLFCVFFFFFLLHTLLRTDLHRKRTKSCTTRNDMLQWFVYSEACTKKWKKSTRVHEKISKSKGNRKKIIVFYSEIHNKGYLYITSLKRNNFDRSSHIPSISIYYNRV